MKKSFTLIELAVTVSIVIVMSAISLGVFYAYQSKSNLGQAAADTKALIEKVQTLAMAPEDPDVSHYILFLNTDQNNTRTPFFQAYTMPEGTDRSHLQDCFHLAPNGGWCIVKEVRRKPLALSPTIAGNSTIGCPKPGTDPNCLPPNVYRFGLARGKINLGKAQISGNPLSGMAWNYPSSANRCTGTSADGSGNGDCGFATLSELGDVAEHCTDGETAYNCQHANEDSIIKVSFRTWDGQVGINGKYFDINYPDLTKVPTDGIATYTLSQNGVKKIIHLNVYSGAVYVTDA